MVYEYRASVLRVIDGDTIEVTLDLGFHTYRKETLRLRGIDAPEMHAADEAQKAKAHAAKGALRAMVITEKPLTIRTYKDQRDKYGRYLAEVFVEQPDSTQLNVSAELVERGFAITRP